MNIVDIFLAAAILIFGWISFRRGTLRIVLSIIGLLVGGALGAIATPSLQSLISSNAFGFRPTIGLTSIILGASLGMFLFGILGGQDKTSKDLKRDTDLGWLLGKLEKSTLLLNLHCFKISTLNP